MKAAQMRRMMKGTLMYGNLNLYKSCTTVRFLRINEIICLLAVHLSCGMNGILLFMVNVTVKSNCSKSHSQLHQIQVKNWPF